MNTPQPVGGFVPATGLVATYRDKYRPGRPGDLRVLGFQDGDPIVALGVALARERGSHVARAEEAYGDKYVFDHIAHEAAAPVPAAPGWYLVCELNGEQRAFPVLAWDFGDYPDSRARHCFGAYVVEDPIDEESLFNDGVVQWGVGDPEVNLLTWDEGVSGPFHATYWPERKVAGHAQPVR